MARTTTKSSAVKLPKIDSEVTYFGGIFVPNSVFAKDGYKHFLLTEEDLLKLLAISKTKKDGKVHSELVPTKDGRIAMRLNKYFHPCDEYLS